MPIYFIKKFERRSIVLFWCLILVQALVWSKFLLSCSMWALAGLSALQFVENEKNKIFFKWRVSPQNFFSFLKNPVLVAITTLFFIVLISGVWSQDMGYWLERVRIKIPFLVLPLVIYFLSPFQEQHIRLILYGLILTMVLSCFFHLGYYIFHFETVNKGLGQGIPIPTIKQHISYGLILAFSILAGIDILEKKETFRYSWERRLLWFCVIFLLISLHIFAIRSSILLLYICLFLKILQIIFLKKYYKMGLLSLIFVFVLPVLAYQIMPSFKKRIGYTLWDLNEYKQGNLGQKSDTDRIISLKVGLKIWEENPIWGVGAGDLWQTTTQKYAALYPTQKPREPHSGIIFTAVGTGILGVFILFLVFGIQFWASWQTRNFLFFQLNVLLLGGNTIDYLFEGSYNVVFHAFFISLFTVVKANQSQKHKIFSFNSVDK